MLTKGVTAAAQSLHGERPALEGLIDADAAEAKPQLVAPVTLPYDEQGGNEHPVLRVTAAGGRLALLCVGEALPPLRFGPDVANAMPSQKFLDLGCDEVMVLVRATLDVAGAYKHVLMPERPQGVKALRNER